jgi:hypothetical protein
MLCERYVACPFFIASSKTLSDGGARLKDVFCFGSNLKCARLMVSSRLGIERVPKDMRPDDYATAEKILRDAGITDFDQKSSGK